MGHVVQLRAVAVSFAALCAREWDEKGTTVARSIAVVKVDMQVMKIRFN
jgi:hypothetical protein